MIFPETFLMELFRGPGQHLMLLFVCLKCVVSDFEAQESVRGNRHADISVFCGECTLSMPEEVQMQILSIWQAKG
jgi:hypothetical protein